jgi:hypothetical protein
MDGARQTTGVRGVERRLSAPECLLLLRLPTVYAVALALNDCGLSKTDIARRVGLPAASLPTLLKIGSARLAALQRELNEGNEAR